VLQMVATASSAPVSNVADEWVMVPRFIRRLVLFLPANFAALMAETVISFQKTE